MNEAGSRTNELGTSNNKTSEGDLSAQGLQANAFSWFDINRYHRARHLRLADWRANIGYRCNLHMWLEYYPCDANDARLIQHLLNPVLVVDDHHPAASTSVVDSSVAEVYCAYQMLGDHRGGTLLRECEDFYQRLESFHAKVFSASGADERERPTMPQGLSESYTESMFPHVIGRFYQTVRVRLDHPDAVIKQDFARWLACKRAKRAAPVSGKGVTAAQLREWARLQVLAFFDLELYCTRTGSRLTNAAMGSMLFPDELSPRVIAIDITERVRKVVRPLAKRIFTIDFLGFLDAPSAGAPLKPFLRGKAPIAKERRDAATVTNNLLQVFRIRR